MVNNALTWKNSYFVGGQATFCLAGSTILARFDGQPCTGSQVSIGVSPASTCPGLVISQTGTLPPATVPTGLPTGSVPTGSLSTYNPIGTGLGTNSFPTSSGAPNCAGRSVFDGTVNSGYLILCNTGLAGTDLPRANGSSLADCISACTSFAGIGGPCVAATYDPTLSSSQCGLKSAIGAVARGAAEGLQAAIVASGPNAPSIVFTVPPAQSTAGPTGGAAGAGGAGATTKTAASAAGGGGNGGGGVATTTGGSPASTGGNNGGGGGSGGSNSGGGNAGTSAGGGGGGGAQTTTGPATNTGGGGGGGASTVISTSATTSDGAAAVATNPSGALCPTYGGKVILQGGSKYQILCDTNTSGNTILGNTTTVTSLNACIAQCNIFNIATPFGCIGVTYLSSSPENNCYLKSAVKSIEYRTVDDSALLIYDGYSQPTFPQLSASVGTVSASSTAAPTNAGPQPTVTDVQGDICPTYNGRTVKLPGDDAYYVICGADSGSNDISGNTRSTDSLASCIGFCDAYNKANATVGSDGCVAVTFNRDNSKDNCYLKNLVKPVLTQRPNIYFAHRIYAANPSGTDVSPLPTGTSASAGTTQIGGGVTNPGSSPTDASITIGGGASSGTTTSAASTTTAAPATAYPCPASNLQNIIAPAGASTKYQVECDYTFSGSNVDGTSATPADTFDACAALCNAQNVGTVTTGCEGFNWRPDLKICYPLYGLTILNSRPGRISGRLVPANTSAVVTNIPTSTSGMTPTSASTSTSSHALVATATARALVAGENPCDAGASANFTARSWGGSDYEIQCDLIMNANSNLKLPSSGLS